MDWQDIARRILANLIVGNASLGRCDGEWYKNGQRIVPSCWNVVLDQLVEGNKITLHTNNSDQPVKRQKPGNLYLARPTLSGRTMWETLERARVESYESYDGTFRNGPGSIPPHLLVVHTLYSACQHLTHISNATHVTVPTMCRQQLTPMATTITLNARGALCVGCAVGAGLLTLPGEHNTGPGIGGDAPRPSWKARFVQAKPDTTR